ncbi:hypothetical protein LJC08_05650 [Methanimicrococcus sp. OttesenSCG-928-J09]|nr:hypothetical protein [Methanimicrococcus sp. OttesenSCG-928-J09]
MENKLSGKSDGVNRDQLGQMKAEVIKMGKFSFEMEEKREQSLIVQSGYMLTGFSIISVMLLAAVPILLDYTDFSRELVFIVLGLSLIFLIFSLFFTIGALWRYEHIGLEDVESIYNLMSFESIDAADDWWLKNINEIYSAKNELNTKRSRFMKASIASFGFSILTILIYLISLFIIML